MGNSQSKAPQKQKSPSTLSTLKELNNLIASSIIELEKACAESELPFPDLDEPFTPQSEAFRKNPAASQAANVIAAAANQLLSTVLPPPMAMGSVLSGHFKSAAVRVCLEANVTEILREGGPEGVHAKDIAAKANISSEKIARLLRYLANHHVYREIRPDVFVNNRISSLLDAGKSVSDILADPASKHDNTPGYAALVGHHVDEVAKSAACLWENMFDPETSLSPETTKAPFNRAFDWPGTFWTWLSQPEQAHRQRRFGVAMKGVSSLEPADSILKAFDWKSLTKSSLIVDVGGGIGASSMILAKNFPDIKIVVQDLPPVAEAGTAFWKSELPAAIESGRVVIQAHDFFEPQPVKDASVFLLKQIMHDWPDFYAIKILTRLREVAKPDTQLILIDSLIPFACHNTSADDVHAVPGAAIKEAPEPLLPNYGVANLTCYTADLTMLNLFNAQERTVKHLTELLQGTGWRLTKVIRNMSDGFLQPVHAVPIF